MKYNYLTYLIIPFLIVIFAFTPKMYAQKMTRIRGKVINANTNEPLPFVNVTFAGKNIGTITDYKGEYSIKTQWASNQLQASFIGYNTQIKVVATGKSNVINFQLESINIELNEVVITAKKKRYRNKDNPAVELIRKVIENKNINRKEKLEFYEYEKYEKVEFDLNNITEKFKNKKAFKKFKFVFNYVDTSAINGKPYLPVFLKETSSKVYYRK